MGTYCRLSYIMSTKANNSDGLVPQPALPQGRGKGPMTSPRPRGKILMTASPPPIRRRSMAKPELKVGTIRRLARRAKITRISALTYMHARCMLNAFLERVLGDAVLLMDNGKRKTVSCMDVGRALKRQGFPMYDCSS